MGEYNKRSFEKNFKKAVFNFNELIAHFEHKGKLYKPSKIVFVWDNKLWKFEMYKSQSQIDLWKNHFIEFFKTGNFDYNGYWRKYTDNNNYFGPIYKIPLCKKNGNDFYEHSEILDKFLKTIQAEGIGGRYGFGVIPKPDETNSINIVTIK